MKVLALCVLLLPAVSFVQAEEKHYEFPDVDQIQLLLTQAERAVIQYEQAINLEAQGGPQLEQSAKTDRDSLQKIREFLDPLKKSPAAFNGPAGFLIVTGLDDASRNMALCMATAGAQSAMAAQTGNYSEAHRLLQIGQSCLDTSTLLYTVSESAVDVYGRFLLAQYQINQQAADALTKCNQIVQNGCKKK